MAESKLSKDLRALVKAADKLVQDVKRDTLALKSALEKLNPEQGKDEPD